VSSCCSYAIVARNIEGCEADWSEADGRQWTGVVLSRRGRSLRRDPMNVVGVAGIMRYSRGNGITPFGSFN